MLKRSRVLSSLMFVLLLTGCATSITYPTTQTFNLKGSVHDQVDKAREMIIDYQGKADGLASTSDGTAKSNIFWGAAMVTAAVYKAPKDVLSGLAIGAGTNTITNGTFNVSGQLAIYQSASSALKCMKSEGEKLERLQARRGGDVAVRTSVFDSHVKAIGSTPCADFERNERAVLAKQPVPSPDDIAFASQQKMACYGDVTNVRQSMNELRALADEANTLSPGEQMADQLQGLEFSVKEKLRALLTSKSANEYKVDLSKLMAAAAAEEHAKNAKALGASGVRSLQDKSRVSISADLNALSAEADYAAAVAGFDAALEKCRANAGI